MDTWGLHMLARARTLQPHLEAFLMERSIFEQHAATLAVTEPVTAGQTLPVGLTAHEQAFYRYLIEVPKGRIEQELLPKELVIRILSGWHSRTEPTNA